MKKISVVICICVLLLATAAVAQAMDVNLYIDTGPDGWNSTLFSAWTPSAFAAAADGTYVNMGGGAHPGTTIFEAQEAIVFSTGDNGSMLLWTFWLPGKTAAEMAGNIQYRYKYDWEGVDYTTDWSTLTAGTSFPAWGDYTNSSSVSGVVGTIGCSWWANDDYAEPYDTGGTIYDETDAADVAALAQEMVTYQTYFGVDIQVREDENSAWETATLNGQLAVPEPTSIMAILFGLGGIAGYRRFRK
ncbi:PEP-CTERM sorting domain-containing protein [bacterium]|nr:PEP-CTERM sorting domain-containing protein [bacterium]